MLTKLKQQQQQQIYRIKTNDTLHTCSLNKQYIGNTHTHTQKVLCIHTYKA